MEVPGASWVELPKGTYSVRSDFKRRSRCQLEVDVCFNHIKSHPCKGEWNKVAPLRILSFDIECAGRKGHFPEVRHCHCCAAVSSSIREATALLIVGFSRSARPGLLCRMQQHAIVQNATARHALLRTCNSLEPVGSYSPGRVSKVYAGLSLGAFFGCRLVTPAVRLASCRPTRTQ